ncbi:NIPSNAP-domain-containing protein [Hypomontagnella submonticulosa]|nr:NIPSNAP-domain-containing protein [Hypomontagnella submonticulosa]
MLTRRIARAAVAAPRSLRAFSSTVANQRTPVIGDIVPEDVDTFNTRQKEFREQLFKAQQEREASRFNRSPPSSNNSSSAARETSQGLGSLSTHTGQRAEASSKEPDRPDNLLSRVIYGTKEGREMDAQLEASFSAVLARGKYVHSIVFHEVLPDKVDEYVQLVGDWYPRMAAIEENKVHLVGSWRTEVGDCDTFVHIWEYQRYQGYHASLHSISRHPDFPEFDRKLKKLIKGKHTSIMQEFSFWPTTPPRQLGGVFELRSYTLHPGNLLEWETHWRRGLKARREVMEGVGAWFVQIGDLNTVHHLWQFANLEERKVRREESWKQEGWAETVHKTVPLIQTMKSRILIPMPWSPVA